MYVSSVIFLYTSGKNFSRNGFIEVTPPSHELTLLNLPTYFLQFHDHYHDLHEKLARKCLQESIIQQIYSLEQQTEEENMQAIGNEEIISKDLIGERDRPEIPMSQPKMTPPMEAIIQDKATNQVIFPLYCPPSPAMANPAAMA